LASAASPGFGFGGGFSVLRTLPDACTLGPSSVMSMAAASTTIFSFSRAKS